MFTPQVVVVGGGLGLVGDLPLRPVAMLLEEFGPPDLPTPIAVMPAALGDDARLIGAAAGHRASAPKRQAAQPPADTVRSGLGRTREATFVRQAPWCPPDQPGLPAT